MSGQKIDLISLSEQNAFVKPSLVVTEENQVENPVPAPSAEPVQPSVKETSPPVSIVIEDESMKEALSKSENRGSSGKAKVVDDIPRRESSQRRPPGSSSRQLPAGSSVKAIASAISEVLNSSQKSSVVQRSSSKRETSSHDDRNTRLPKAEGRKPKTPPLSEDMKKVLEEDEQQPSPEDINMMPQTPAEKHNYWKTRLQILKTSFPDVSIPRNSDELDWKELQKIYYIELDRVSLSKNVDSYKMIMLVLFFIVEGVGARIFKIDITGFTVHSWKSMRRYERLLIELGEKNYSSFGENWPVELRLAGLVLVNAIIFVLAKYIFKLTGQDASNELFDMFNNIGNQNVESDLGQGAGMTAPSPGAKDGDNGGGLLGMLGGLLGGGGGGLGGLASSLFGGAGNAKQPPGDHPKGVHGDEDGERIKPPSYAPRRKARRAKSENDVGAQ